MIYNSYLTAHAEKDLNEIISYMENELCNHQAASRFYYSVADAIEQINSFPASGTPIDNEYVRNKSVRKINIGNYILYYISDNEELTNIVVRIVYGRRNIEDTVYKNI